MRVEGPLFALLGVGNGGTADRLGLAAGRRLGNAVVRNRLKRMARECFRKHHRTDVVVGLDLVLVPKPAMIGSESSAVEREYERRLGALARRRISGRRGATPTAGN
jgi:ribonuclease P protein component